MRKRDEILQEKGIVKMGEQGYHQLEIYQRAHRLAVEVHRMSLALPKFEMFETGAQIRRSAKSVSAQIVEGYCLRKNKKEFVQYLNRAHASAHETVEHLRLLHETGSLAQSSEYTRLLAEYDILCRMIFRFMEGVMDRHDKPGFVREEMVRYALGPHTSNPTSDFRHLKSHIQHLTSG